METSLGPEGSATSARDLTYTFYVPVPFLPFDQRSEKLTQQRKDRESTVGAQSWRKILPV